MPKSLSLGSEPVAIIAAIVSLLQVVQALTLTGISSGVHAVIAVVLVLLGGLIARNKVGPTVGKPQTLTVPTPPAS